MRRRAVWRGIGGACAIGLVVLAGCGGKGSSSTATTKSGSSTTAPSFSGSKNSKYCDLARQFSGTISGSLSSDPRVLFQEFDTLAGQFVSVAPSQIKSDAQTVVDAVKRLEAAFKAVNYDATKLSPTDVAVLQDPKVAAATSRINAYDDQVCGITTTTTTTT